MIKFFRKYFTYICLIVCFIFIIFFFFIKNKLNNNSTNIVEENYNSNENIALDGMEVNLKNDQKVIVDIKGAVKKPGVYVVTPDKVINDVIELAGGLLDSANTSVINLAKKVENEMVIIVYTDDEVKNSNIVDTVVKVIEKECNCPNIKNDGCVNTEIKNEIGNSDKLVNLNTATVTELQTINGIGESKAQSIIEYRNTNGLFSSVDELKEVPGIGEKLYEQIKIYFTT